MLKTFKTINDYLADNNYFIDTDLKSDFDLLSNLGSSYQKNNYWRVFNFLIQKHSPLSCAELGVLGCYSIISMGLSASQNSMINGYDLFEDYPYNSFEYKKAIELIKAFNLEEKISLHKKDIFKNSIYKEIIAQSELIHVDLSNDGETLEKILAEWNPLNHKVFIFEGGSKDRDQVEWMIKYNKIAMNSILEKYSTENKLHIQIIEDYPSLTIIEAAA